MALTDEILAHEGGINTNSSDNGGITKFGITAATLSWYKGHPATAADVKALTADEAKAIYSKLYIIGPGFDKLPVGVLQSNMVDFGVMSGPLLAIMNLQDVLHVAADGVLGPITFLALSNSNLDSVNKAIVKKRVMMVARICVKTPSQLVFLVGWLSRILSFNS